MTGPLPLPSIPSATATAPRHAGAGRALEGSMQRVGGRGPRASAGFTLIEVMITVAIVAILAGIAYPTYTDYIVRGRLVDAATALRATRARMEQYYQDNRTYTSVSSSIVSPCMDTQV